MENSKNIKHCINEKGEVNVSPEELKSSIEAAEKLCKSFLGRTINVRGNKFIIQMLERADYEKTHIFLKSWFLADVIRAKFAHIGSKTGCQAAGSNCHNPYLDLY